MAVLVTSTIGWARPPRISGGGGVITVPREADPVTPGGERFEVFADTLAEIPIVFQVSLGMALDPPGITARLENEGVRWHELILPTVVKDGDTDDEYGLEMIRGSERVEWNQFAEHGPRGFSADVPNSLASGEAVYTLWKLVGPDGNTLPAGVYDVSFATRPAFDFSSFFGVPGGFGGSAHILVKEFKGKDANDYREDLIERHYLWACWLYKFERDASKKEFEKAWKLVQDYLRRPTPGPGPENVLRSPDGVILKAGDEPGFWNATPRFQAMRIAGWLDRRKDQIRYMQELAIANGAAKNGQLKLKMRYYHFGNAQDQLPHNFAGELVHGLNRTYEQVYGKTMQGKPVKPLPIRKNFPDEPENLQHQP